MNFSRKVVYLGGFAVGWLVGWFLVYLFVSVMLYLSYLHLYSCYLLSMSHFARSSLCAPRPLTEAFTASKRLASRSLCCEWWLRVGVTFCGYFNPS
jgi:hypothetical protein